MASEKNFENRVKKWLKEHGAWYLKTWGGGYQRNGIPDLLICWKGKFIGVELKAENGTASELQKYELKTINDAGGIGIILKPSGFDDFKNFLLKM